MVDTTVDVVEDATSSSPVSQFKLLYFVVDEEPGGGRKISLSYHLVL